MLHYREPTPDNKFYDTSTHCEYCGVKLDSRKGYCSYSCEEKDSVWHKEDDM
ncbi:MAG: hypothetical protein OEM77_07150 [Nitrosopumilus sp.]|nr:hypothetical protein [Nitrosopumilus sp.]MDH3736089.1 hypothetical protein [Nitrosopumilus sp.]MDH3822460.1 hypothetical protein [Nitrosopumilus sp.]MDH3832908.1 hypothetical protein [Nitrosopumilus sp.]